MHEYFCLLNGFSMLERYGYPEQSLRQALIIIDSYVACLDIQRKSGENTLILYVVFYYHFGYGLLKRMPLKSKYPCVIR